MLEKIEELLVEVNSFQTQSKGEIEQFRIKFSGKKGILNEFFEKFKEVPNEQKKDFGQKIIFVETSKKNRNVILALIALEIF